MLAQLGSLPHAPPGLETPPHMVLRKRKDYEVRRCATQLAVLLCCRLQCLTFEKSAVLQTAARQPVGCKSTLKVPPSRATRCGICALQV